MVEVLLVRRQDPRGKGELKGEHGLDCNVHKYHVAGPENLIVA